MQDTIIVTISKNTFPENNPNEFEISKTKMVVIVDGSKRNIAPDNAFDNKYLKVLKLNISLSRTPVYLSTLIFEHIGKLKKNKQRSNIDIE